MGICSGDDGRDGVDRGDLSGVGGAQSIGKYGGGVGISKEGGDGVGGDGVGLWK